MIDVSKYLHFSLETEIGTMDDDSNAVINKEQRNLELELLLRNNTNVVFFLFYEFYLRTM